MFTVAGLNQFADLMHEIVAALETMDVPVEQLGKEYGSSQFEFSTRYSDSLGAADRYLIGKEVTRALALQHGQIASHMPKPFAEHAGNGLHIHLAALGCGFRRKFADGHGAGRSPERDRTPFRRRLDGTRARNLWRRRAHGQLL